MYYFIIINGYFYKLENSDGVISVPFCAFYSWKVIWISNVVGNSLSFNAVKPEYQQYKTSKAVDNSINQDLIPTNQIYIFINQVLIPKNLILIYSFCSRMGKFSQWYGNKIIVVYFIYV